MTKILRRFLFIIEMNLIYYKSRKQKKRKPRKIRVRGMKFSVFTLRSDETFSTYIYDVAA